MNPNRLTPRHIIIKVAKERILEATRDKQRVICNGLPIIPSVDFSAETLQARREWHDILKVRKGENL